MTRAHLPIAGYRRPEALTGVAKDLSVRFYEERSGRSRVFEFSHFPVPKDIAKAMAKGFALSTGPGGTRRTIVSADSFHAGLLRYAKYLSEHSSPPRGIAGLRPIHIRELKLRADRRTTTIIQSLRLAFRSTPGIPPDYWELLLAPKPRVQTSQQISGYSPSEFRAIRRALRTTVRSAVDRIRRLESEVEHAKGLRSANSFLSPRQLVLLSIADTGDIPRTAFGNVKYRRGATIAGELLPSGLEVASAALLLQCLTGHNIGTLLNLSVEHQRADDQASENMVVLTRAHKPRRGRYLSELDLTFDSHDVWQEAQPTIRDALGQPAGVFQAVLEMCARARRTVATESLFCFYSPFARMSTEGGHGCRRLYALTYGGQIEWSHLGEERVGVDSQRIRRSFISLRQRPVDHTPATMADSYLLKEPSDLAENQVVVSTALDDEVVRIQENAAVQTMTIQQVHLAGSDPESVARQLNLEVDTLQELLAGQLDTVATACVSNSASPYSPVGLACTASFMLCLGCPNSVAEPRHLPALRTLKQRMENRREGETTSAWQQKYGTAYGQVTDILEHLSHAGMADATPEESDERARLIDQLLDGKLDIR